MAQFDTIDKLVNRYGKVLVVDFLTKVNDNTNDIVTKEWTTTYLAYLGKAEATPLSKDDCLEKINNVKVGITYSFSLGAFKEHYPNIELITNKDNVSKYNLIIVPGGADINPSYYGEPNKACDVDVARDSIEVPIVQAAINSRIKMLGICRGHELINVLRGCSYIQDLFGYGFKTHPSTHTLSFENAGILYKFFNKRKVTSMHHQGITSSNLRATCRYEGIIEGCESPNIITTQFHPEFMDKTEDFFTYIKAWSIGLQNYV